MNARPQPTPEQQAIISAPHGSLFVAAAAGVGKTTVLTARFVAMVLGDAPHPGAGIDQIATITFTDKAAGEIAERIRQALIERGRVEESRRLDRAWISTIHGMCSRILRRHAFDAGLDPRFSVITGAQESALSSSALEDSLRACVHDDEICERVLIGMGASRLMATVTHLSGRLRSMGLSPADLIEAPRVDDAQLRRIAADLREIADEMGALKETKTIATNRETLYGKSSIVDGLNASAEWDTADAALGALLENKTVSAQGSPELKELAARGKATIEEAIAATTGIICQYLERALIKMTATYDTTYSTAKEALGALDFEDLQLKTVDLLTRHPEIARRYQTTFQELMIDEFQDTNPLQVSVATLVGTGDLVTVGDDKQSIYRFRHADVDVFRRRAAEAPERMELRSNWRTHPDVLAAINGLFSSAEFFADDFMRIEPARTKEAFWPEGEDRVRLLVVDSGELRDDDVRRAEAAELARELRRLVDRGVEQGEVAVLLRAASGGRAEIVEEALRSQGLRVYVARGGTYYDRPEVTDAVMLLRAIDNPLDDEALAHVLACPLTGLSDDALHVLRQRAERGEHVPLWTEISNPKTPLAPDDAALLGRTREVIERLRADRGRLSIAEVLHTGCELLEYDITLFASGPSGPRAWANVLKLARVAEEFNELEPGDLGGFLDFVALRSESDEDRQATLVAEDVDAVRVMTIHAAKGLEFGVVAVPMLDSGMARSEADVLIDTLGGPSLALRLPSSMSPDSEYHATARNRILSEYDQQMEEEEAKRVFYVACTRAKEALILCGVASPEKEAKNASMLSRVRRALGIAMPGETVSDTLALENASIVVDVRDVAAPERVACPPVERPPVGELPPLHVPGTTCGGFVPTHVSYSALSTYDACPYRYYATSVARLGAGIESERGGASAREFGNAAHAALQLAVTDRLTPARLAGIATAHGLDEDAATRLGAAVDAFLGSPVASEVRAADAVLAECPISVPVRETLLTGSIDLLARSGDRVLVVDYKTGHGEKRPDAYDRYRDQGGCYALAALRDGATSVDVVFVEIERDCAVTPFTFTPDDVKAIERSIEARLDRMRAGEFGHLEAYSAEVCPGCPALGGLCPVTYPS
ncbi:MAG: UvrD-helicase domain-containing protein [Coriobacteriia bacterium]